MHNAVMTLESGTYLCGEERDGTTLCATLLISELVSCTNQSTKTLSAGKHV